MVFQKISRLFSVFTVIIALSSACDYKNDSYGNFDEIVVIADSALYLKVRPQVEQIFDRYIYTPHVERSFLLNYQAYERLGIFQMRRNLLFLALLDAEDPVSKYISNVLSKEVKDAIRSGRIFQIFHRDFFASDQMAMILCAENASDLEEKMKNQADAIYTKLEEYHFERLAKIMFLRAEQTLLEEYFANTMGWEMRIQHDYFVAQESSDKNFVWFRRLKPDRSLFVYRQKASSLPEGEEWLIHLRDSITTQYFEGDSVETSDTYILRITFNDRPALKMIGVWQNHQLLVGGPFRTFAFHDPNKNYIYLIDIQVVAPGKRKKPFLDQLEVMARSFRIRG
jgi:hypothetical protein